MQLRGEAGHCRPRNLVRATPHQRGPRKPCVDRLRERGALGGAEMNKGTAIASGAPLAATMHSWTGDIRADQKWYGEQIRPKTVSRDSVPMGIRMPASWQTGRGPGDGSPLHRSERLGRAGEQAEFDQGMTCPAFRAIVRAWTRTAWAQFDIRPPFSVQGAGLAWHSTSAEPRVSIARRAGVRTRSSEIRHAPME